MFHDHLSACMIIGFQTWCGDTVHVSQQYIQVPHINQHLTFVLWRDHRTICRVSSNLRDLLIILKHIWIVHSLLQRIPLNNYFVREFLLKRPCFILFYSGGDSCPFSFLADDGICCYFTLPFFSPIRFLSCARPLLLTTFLFRSVAICCNMTYSVTFVASDLWGLPWPFTRLNTFTSPQRGQKGR